MRYLLFCITKFKAEFAWHKIIHYLCPYEKSKPIGYCVVSNLHF